MASRLLQFHLSESEDSMDDVDFLPELYSSNMENNRVLQNLENNIDVVSGYKFLRNLAELSNCRKKPSVKTKGIQTDPDTLGIPPSWIIAGQSMVEKIYTDLQNLINTIYHSPVVKDKQYTKAGKEPNTCNMKYFSYKDGYWVSSLLPHIKIPDERIRFTSTNIGTKLDELLETAGKLKIIIPYVYENINTLSHEENKDESNLKVMVNKFQQTEDFEDSNLCLCKQFSNLHENVGQIHIKQKNAKTSGHGYNASNKISDTCTNSPNLNNVKHTYRKIEGNSSDCQTKGVSVTKCKINRHKKMESTGINASTNIFKPANLLKKDEENFEFKNGLILIKGKVMKTKKECKPGSILDDCSSIPGTSTQHENEQKSECVAREFSKNVKSGSNQHNSELKIKSAGKVSRKNDLEALDEKKGDGKTAFLERDSSRKILGKLKELKPECKNERENKISNKNNPRKMNREDEHTNRLVKNVTSKSDPGVSNQPKTAKKIGLSAKEFNVNASGGSKHWQTESKIGFTRDSSNKNNPGRSSELKPHLKYGLMSNDRKRIVPSMSEQVKIDQNTADKIEDSVRNGPSGSKQLRIRSIEAKKKS